MIGSVGSEYEATLLSLQRYYIATSRHLRRLESTSKSPVYVHFSETLTGSSSIRAYGVEKRFIKTSNSLTDTNHLAYFPSVAATQWLTVYLELFGYLIVFMAALLAVLARDTMTAGNAGLSITAALTVSLGMIERSRTTRPPFEHCTPRAGKTSLSHSTLADNSQPERARAVLFGA